MMARWSLHEGIGSARGSYAAALVTPRLKGESGARGTPCVCVQPCACVQHGLGRTHTFSGKEPMNLKKSSLVQYVFLFRFMNVGFYFQKTLFLKT